MGNTIATGDATAAVVSIDRPNGPSAQISEARHAAAPLAATRDVAEKPASDPTLESATKSQRDWNASFGRNGPVH